MDFPLANLNKLLRKNINEMLNIFDKINNELKEKKEIDQMDHLKSCINYM